MKLLKFMVLLLLLLSSQNANSQNYDKAKDLIGIYWESFLDAWVKGNAKQCADLFTQDGVHIRPLASIDVGKKEIENSFKHILSNSNVEFCIQETIKIDICDSKIIEYGTYQQKWYGNNDIYKGAYLAIWTSDLNKSLKIKILIFN